MCFESNSSSKVACSFQPDPHLFQQPNSDLVMLLELTAFPTILSDLFLFLSLFEQFLPVFWHVVRFVFPAEFVFYSSISDLFFYYVPRLKLLQAATLIFIFRSSFVLFGNFLRCFVIMSFGFDIFLASRMWELKIQVP